MVLLFLVEENVCLSFLNFARIQFQRGQCKYSRLQLRVCPHSFTQSGHILMSERSWNSIKQEDCKIEVGTVDVIKPKSPTEAKEKNQVGKSVVVPRTFSSLRSLCGVQGRSVAGELLHICAKFYMEKDHSASTRLLSRIFYFIDNSVHKFF
uniref:Uncharacterized protein n=1 Tax=Trichobilharzia regenti TaxID=157069 RepID=A0AA85JAR1_TRIRE|nr:unnamed protein product [Trichobilharzia regenti]